MVSGGLGRDRDRHNESSEAAIRRWGAGGERQFATSLAIVRTASSPTTTEEPDRNGVTSPNGAAPAEPMPATPMHESKADALASMAFSARHRTRLHGTNALDRLNGEVKRRSDVVGIF